MLESELNQEGFEKDTEILEYQRWFVLSVVVYKNVKLNVKLINNDWQHEIEIKCALGCIDNQIGVIKIPIQQDLLIITAIAMILIFAAMSTTLMSVATPGKICHLCACPSFAKWIDPLDLTLTIMHIECQPR